MVEIYKPLVDDLWFKELMMSDEDTMSYNHAYGGTIPFPKDKWNDWYNRWIINNGKEKYYRYLKDSNNNFVGEISYHYDSEKNVYLCDVVIYSKYRGNGYGKEGLNLLCKIAKENGLVDLYDEIAIDNTSVNLFLKIGFIVINKTKESIIIKKNLI